MAELIARGPGLWTIDHPHSTGGLALGTRTTLVELPDGIWVHSAGPWPGTLLAQLPGPVTALCAPNTMHFLYLPASQQIFPEARTFLCPGLAKKRPELKHDELLRAQPAWPGTLEQHSVQGLKNFEEYVFFHPPSQTLILVDLVFNLRKTPSLFTRLFMTLNGAFGRLGPSRIFKSMLMGDKRELGRSIDHILSWDFQRVVMGHGDVQETDAREMFREAFRFTSR
jgi:hypothetical protein